MISPSDFIAVSRRSLPIVFASVLVLVSAQLCSAGPLATTGFAYNDGVVWQGSQTLSGVDVFANPYSGDVDYAVFNAGGDFQSFLDAEYGGGTYVDPTGGSAVIYAFQIEITQGNVQALNAGYDDNPLLVDDLESYLAAPSSIVGSGSYSPASSIFNDASARWYLAPGGASGGGLPSGTGPSDILFYASTFLPKPDQVTLGGAFLTGQADSGPEDYASPDYIPEPQSVIMLIGGCATLLLNRKRMSC